MQFKIKIMRLTDPVFQLTVKEMWVINKNGEN